MSDAFSKITAILLCVFMMYIIPVFYLREESNRAKQTYILEEVTGFVDGARNTGILSSDEYAKLENILFSLGGGYTIEITHCTHMHDKSGEKTEYFESINYTPQILQAFANEDVYFMGKNDYVRVVVYDVQKSIVAWYGGSVRYEAY